ncbi:hypothetical protein GF322_01305 [Candidatus Dependentiae bacterium]|nr:hypothetical protein [Candidatus Dependentiae bacterium]
MKKIDDIIINFDRKVDQKIKPVAGAFQKYFPIFSISLFALLILLFVVKIFHNKPYFAAAIITTDIKKIVNALNNIDDDCSILKIKDKNNFIDFLNITKFTGSEVGPLNLAYPKNWRGPYLYDNPTMQGKLYRIVRTKEGIFIVPGDFVKLPNGLHVGKDFKIDYNSSILKMIDKGGALNYKGRPLAAKLKFKIGDWQKPKIKKEEIAEINSVLEEFNAAMPFTHNQTVPYRC